ncbi:multidrug effflux MFS transporter [Pelagibaculum spongiae]|uniref:Multidrug transporter n=1 Tax=Pelagibaculum spongiae TaxID=2080658 RepID=A0A2V1H0M4_9GAMM|nr:multidrug effflux MFS transporter [Pelagibaculum spongiae]PVZ68849.1 multidrug transporter [Pelagibaculum spongiae]
MSQTARNTLPLIFLLAILSPMSIDIYLPSIPEMALWFNAAESDLHSTLTLFMFCLGFGQLAAGPIADRLGRKKVALGGVVLFIIGAIIAIFAKQLEVLNFARSLQGLGAACGSVSAFAWIRDNFAAEEAGRWISYIGGAIGLMPTFAPILGSLLALNWGWQANFGFMVIAGLFLMAGIMMRFANDAPIKMAAEESQKNDAMIKSGLKSDLLEIITNRQFLISSISGMFAMGAIISYATHAPTVAITMAGMSSIGFSILFGINGLVQLVSSLFAPTVSKRIGPHLTIALGLVIAGLAAVGLWTLDSTIGQQYPLIFFALTAVFGVAFNLIFGTAAGLALAPFGHCAGTAAALDGFARMAGGALIATLVTLPGLSAFNTVALAFGLLLLPLPWFIKDGMFNNQEEINCDQQYQPQAA